MHNKPIWNFYKMLLYVYYLSIVDKRSEIFTTFKTKATKIKHDYLSQSYRKAEWHIAERFYKREMKPAYLLILI